MIRPFLAIAAAILSAGCTNSLFVAHDTVVGFNASVSGNRQEGHVVLGYDRDFAAMVPMIEPPHSAATGQPTGQREAMGIFGCSRLETRGIYLTRYSDVLATGAAATSLGTALGNNEPGASRLVTCADREEDAG